MYLDILKLARDKIADKDHWCQDWFALDMFGNDISPSDITADRYCAVGAIHSARHELGATEEDSILASGYLHQSCKKLFNLPANSVNDLDTLGHDAIMEAYNRTIAMLEGIPTTKAEGELVIA